MPIYGAVRCKHKCPYGGECTLNGGIDHELHICRDDCPCHSEQRYLEAKRARETKAAELASVVR